MPGFQQLLPQLDEEDGDGSKPGSNVLENSKQT